MGANIEKKPTGYERKQLRQAEAETVVKKKDWTTPVIIAIVAAFIIVVVAAFFISKNNGTKKAFMTIGEHEVTQLEYDYYYYTLVNNFYNNNSDYLLFYGIDTSKPLDEQMCIYDTNLTWKDYFDQTTVPIIQAIKALVDESKEVGYEYDDSVDYETYIAYIDYQIQMQGISEDYFYTNMYGKYASEKALEPIVREYLLYQSYYNQCLLDNAVTAEDVQAYYEENYKDYDSVNYYLYTFVTPLTADGEEQELTAEELEAEMVNHETRAAEMVSRFAAGEDWRELCYEYANENSKASYDPTTESDVTYVEGSTYAYISPDYVDWLYAEERVADDVYIHRDDENEAVFVIRFADKSIYDVEADESGIADTMAEQILTAHIDELLVDYQVADPKGNLPYLTKVSETTAETAAETTAE